MHQEEKNTAESTAGTTGGESQGGDVTRIISFSAAPNENGIRPAPRLVLYDDRVVSQKRMAPMTLMGDGGVPAPRPMPVKRSYRSLLSWSNVKKRVEQVEATVGAGVDRGVGATKVLVKEGVDHIDHTAGAFVRGVGAAVDAVEREIKASVVAVERSIHEVRHSRTHAGQVAPLVNPGPPDLAGGSVLYGANGSVIGVLEEGTEPMMDGAISESEVPQEIVRMMLLVSYNALLQCTADVAIETLMLAGLVPKIELRVSFIFLTFLSALLAIHTLGDIDDNRLDTTVQSMRVGMLVEFGLVSEDIYFIAYEPDPYIQSLKFYYRIAFLFLTCVNIALMVKLSRRLHIMHLLFPRHTICGCCFHHH